MSSTVHVFVIRFDCPVTKQRKWLDQSLDFHLANKVCKLMARSGKKPVLYRFSLDLNRSVLTRSGKKIYAA